jgi:hypothetical protein
MTIKNILYTFNGEYAPDVFSDELRPFEAKFSVNKRGFFKGRLSNSEGVYNIVGHMKNEGIVTRIAYILAEGDCRNAKKVHSLISSNTNENLEGKFIGEWYMNIHELNVKLLPDYDAFKKFISRSGVGGYVDMDLKKV